MEYIICHANISVSKVHLVSYDLEIQEMQKSNMKGDLVMKGCKQNHQTGHVL